MNNVGVDIWCEKCGCGHMDTSDGIIIMGKFEPAGEAYEHRQET